MPLDRRALLTLLVLPVLALVAGLVALGGNAPDPAAAAAGAGRADACAQRALKYVVTDDAAELNRQNAFEATSAVDHRRRLLRRRPAEHATLHAASHGSVVVFYRPGLPAGQLRPLRALVARGRRDQGARDRRAAPPGRRP